MINKSTIMFELFYGKAASAIPYFCSSEATDPSARTLSLY